MPELSSILQSHNTRIEVLLQVHSVLLAGRVSEVLILVLCDSQLLKCRRAVMDFILVQK